MNVAPSQTIRMFKIVNRKKTRRELEIFEVPAYRLRQTGNTLFYKGPKLYNMTVNEINKTLPFDVTPTQNKFLNSFKSVVTKYLLQLQNEGGDTWDDTNFSIIF